MGMAAKMHLRDPAARAPRAFCAWLAKVFRDITWENHMDATSTIEHSLYKDARLRTDPVTAAMTQQVELWQGPLSGARLVQRPPESPSVVG